MTDFASIIEPIWPQDVLSINMASVLVMPMLICHQTSLESSPREKDGSKIQSERREREREREEEENDELTFARRVQSK